MFVYSAGGLPQVRGINLGDNDQVIWMSILQHTDTSAEQREMFIQASRAQRRFANT